MASLYSAMKKVLLIINKYVFVNDNMPLFIGWWKRFSFNKNSNRGWIYHLKLFNIIDRFLFFVFLNNTQWLHCAKGWTNRAWCLCALWCLCCGVMLPITVLWLLLTLNFCCHKTKTTNLTQKLKRFKCKTTFQSFYHCLRFITFKTFMGQTNTS